MELPTYLPAGRPACLPTIHTCIHTYVRTYVHTHVRTWRTSSASVFDATQKSVSVRRTFGCQALRVCCRPWLRIGPLWTVLWGWQLASIGFRGFLLGLYTEHQVNDVRRQLNIVKGSGVVEVWDVQLRPSVLRGLLQKRGLGSLWVSVGFI